MRVASIGGVYVISESLVGSDRAGDRPSRRLGAGRSHFVHAGGQFLFTVEAKDGEAFELGPKRRYRHSESYLREEAATCGFDVMGLIACSPRSEANRPVDGFAAALQKSAE